MKKTTSIILVFLFIMAMSSSVFAAPAAPLTDLQIVAIYSTNGGFEIIQDNQIRSIENHGGAEFYIITAEDGYSSSQFARMNNGPLLTAVFQQMVDVDGDNIVDGWMRYWDASNYSNGTFTIEATSTNAPWNTMYDELIVR